MSARMVPWRKCHAREQLGLQHAACVHCTHLWQLFRLDLSVVTSFFAASSSLSLSLILFCRLRRTQQQRRKRNQLSSCNPAPSRWLQRLKLLLRQPTWPTRKPARPPLLSLACSFPCCEGAVVKAV